MSIKFSICITYYYHRSNIYELLSQFQNENSKELEILIYNDNKDVNLEINSNLNLKIFQNKSKAIGELESIKLLLEKAEGKYVSIIADDDLMSAKMLNLVKKDNFNHTAYLSQTTKSKILFESFNQKNNKSYKTDFSSYSIL